MLSQAPVGLDQCASIINLSKGKVNEWLLGLGKEGRIGSGLSTMTNLH